MLYAVYVFSGFDKDGRRETLVGHYPLDDARREAALLRREGAIAYVVEPHY